MFRISEIKRGVLRLLALLIAAATLGIAVCGCSEPTEPDAPDVTDAPGNVTDTTAGDTSSEETRPPLDIPPGSRYDGYEFTVFCRDEGTAGAWDTYDVISAEMTGEAVNDAVYQRQLVMEETYGVKLLTAVAAPGDLVNQARTTIQAGDGAYDAVLTDIQRCANLASSNVLLDLYGINHIDTTKPWWDSYVAKTASIGGKLFFAMGDINIIDNSATWSVLFNKRLAADFTLEDHYALVNDNKWTIDVLTANSTTATGDLDGDGNLEPKVDRWGTLNQRETLIALFAAGGGLTVTKDADDLPVLCVADEGMQQVLNKVIAFKQNFDIQINADDHANDWTGVLITPFAEGLGLYYIAPLSSLDSLREMEDELGILPLPLINEGQTEYVSSLQYNNATAYCVPVTADDTDRTGIILEAMAYESDATLTKAYYETTLKRKYSNDAESGEMLDLIFSTRIVDIGLTYDWGSMQNFMQKFAAANANEFAGEFAKVQKSITKTMDKFLEKWAEN